MTPPDPTSLRPPMPRPWRGVDARSSTSDVVRYTQGALALSFQLPNGLDAIPSTRAVTLVDGCEPDLVPDAEPWAARIIAAIVEVVAGHRPVSQILRFTNGRVYADVARRATIVADQKAPARRKLGRPQVATVHLYRPDARSAEVAARIVMGARSRAIAARLEYVSNRWTCTSIAFG